MWIQILWVVVTALLSSLFTIALAFLLFEKLLRPRLEEEIDRRVLEAIDELGREVETRVKRGVVEAVAALPSTEVLAGATRTAARSGVDFLGSILGAGKRPDER